MCTVTYLPLKQHNFILTSNRDEQRNRITLNPKSYQEGQVKMMYPKDKIAGGTWIGVSEKQRLVCVLNGGFIKHHRKLQYSKSRGLIAKELLAAEDFETVIPTLNLKGVEPFTMVIVDWSKNKPKLFELVWDESKTHFQALKNEPRICSSSTLYTDDIKNVRRQWFKEWIDQNAFTRDSILEFHHSEIGEKSQSVLMKRPYVETVSITSVVKNDQGIEMYYEDIIHCKEWTSLFE